MFRRAFAALLVSGLAALSAHAQTALQPPPAAFAPGPQNTGHLTAELVSQTTGVAPGGLAYIAIRQDIQKGWHTYWRNPGDSGEATSAKWDLPQGWSAGDWVWPAPRRLPLGPLMNYGYTGQVLLPVALNVPASAKPGTTQTLKADVTFLVCADICVPEEAKLQLDVPVVSGVPADDPKWGAAIAKTIMDSPKASDLTAVAAWQGSGPDKVLKLAVTGQDLKGADLSHAYFFPYDAKSIDHAAKQRIEKGPDGLTLTLKPSTVVANAPDAPALSGVLSLGGQAYEVQARPGVIPAGAGGQGEVSPAPLQSEDIAQSTAGTATAGAAIPAAGADLGLLPAVLFAFVGGLILNLMPCVFPVLSMKAASLAAHAHEPGEAKRQGLAFLAGVLATFLLLAGLLLAAKAGGAAIGWGFQLQSPAVVGALALTMLLVALNLSGVFEATLPGQGAGGSLAAKGGLAGAFFTGALAVVVAAPCTAPFMAAALGFALTQSAPAALLVFLGLGLGFAAPFVAVAFIPGLLQRLPRPGAWMDTLKHVLAFPMYGTAAWLLWVFTLQAGSGALAALLAAAVLVGLTAWLMGAAQRAGKPLVPGFAALVAAGLAVACLVVGARQGASAETASTGAAPAETGGAEAPSQPFTPEKLADLRAQGKPVFVNFTAAWCVTCQVNERLALGAPSVAKALADTGAVYLKADWTNHDSSIARMLADHGRAGVPLYLVYGAAGGDPVVLPQLLTPGSVVSAIKAAAKPKA